MKQIKTPYPPNWVAAPLANWWLFYGRHILKSRYQTIFFAQKDNKNGNFAKCFMLVFIGFTGVAMPSVGNATQGPNSKANSDVETEIHTRRVAAEIDLLGPFIPEVRIIRPKVTIILWGALGKMRGDLVLGLYIRPHIRHDLLYRIDEYMATVGYRQYFWRGLHLEFMANVGAAWGTNRYDKKYYKTPTLFFDAQLGYRFDFFVPGGFLADKKHRFGFFVAPQAGVLFSGGISDIGPRRGKPDVFVSGTLSVGLIF